MTCAGPHWFAYYGWVGTSSPTCVRDDCEAANPRYEIERDPYAGPVQREQARQKREQCRQDRLLTTAQLARIRGVPMAKIQQMVRDGLLARDPTSRRRHLFDPDHIWPDGVVPAPDVRAGGEAPLQPDRDHQPGRAASPRPAPERTQT